MKPAPAPTLFEVRRGERLDEVELIDDAGNVVILVADGVNAPERARVREAAMVLLAKAQPRRRVDAGIQVSGIPLTDEDRGR